MSRGASGALITRLLLAVSAICVAFANVVSADDVLTTAPPGALVWLTSLDKAKEQAKLSKKPILAAFTDASSPIKRDLFSTPEFQEWAASSVILLSVDFPSRAHGAQDEATRRENLAVASRYGVHKLPAVLFLDATGRVLIVSGYLPGNANRWVKLMCAQIDPFTWADEWKPEIDKRVKLVKLENGFHVCRAGGYIVKTKVDPLFTAKLSLYVDLTVSAVAGLLDLPPARRPGVRPEVIVYGGETEFRRVVPSKARGCITYRFSPSPAAGKSDGPTAFEQLCLLTYVEGQNDRDFDRFCHPVINHEVTHLLLRICAGRNPIPSLLDEGLASYVGKWNLFRDARYNMENRSRIFSNVPCPARNEVPRLSELYFDTTWDVDGFGRRTLVRYLAAEMFIEQQLRDDRGRAFLTQMLRDSFAGKTKAAETVRTLDAMQGSFVEYVMKNSGGQ